MVGCRATAGAILSRFGGNLAQLKNIASHFRFVNYCAIFLGMLALRAGTMTRIITVAQYGYSMS